MRLNPDCIRDILISFKDKIDLSIPYIVNEANCKDICDKYSSKELCYHVRQCLYHDFITGTDKGNCIEVKGISPVGHDFLSYFYDEKDWIEINKIATEIGTHSLEALKQISILRKIKEIEMKNSKGGIKMLTTKTIKGIKEERINKIKSLSSEILKLMQDSEFSNEEAEVLLKFVKIEYEFLK